MDINIEVKYSGVNLQQLKNAQDNIVHVAESTRLAFFGVVQASSPIDSDICSSVDNSSSAIDGPTCRQLTEIIKPVEGGAVERIAHFECLLEPEFGYVVAPFL